MNSSRSNYFYQLLYRLSICILPLIITPFSARVLGVEGVGLYTFSSAVACYFIMFGKLGMDHYGSRTIACVRHDPEKLRRTFWSVYAMQIMTSLASFLLYLLVVHLAFPEDIRIYWMQALYVLTALFDVTWFFHGTEQFRLATLRSLLSRAILVAAMFLLVHTAEDLWIYTLIMSACFLLEQVLLLPFLLKQAPPVRVSFSEIRPHLTPSIKLFLPLVALSIYNWMDKLMLGLMAGNDAVAVYNYADSIINLPKGIITALGTVMLPKLSRLAARGDVDSCQRSLRSGMSLICCICCLLCFGIAGVAPVFVPFFLGPAYTETIRLTIALALVMIPMSVVDVLQMQYLIPFGQEKIYIRSVSLGAAVNLVLNGLAIPHLGAMGAVIGTLGAQIAVCGYQLCHVRRVYPLREMGRALWPFLICGLAAFLVAWRVGTLPLAPLPLLCQQVVLAGGAYLLCAGAFLMWIRPDLREMLGVLKTGEPNHPKEG